MQNKKKKFIIIGSGIIAGLIIIGLMINQNNSLKKTPNTIQNTKATVEKSKIVDALNGELLKVEFKVDEKLIKVKFPKIKDGDKIINDAPKKTIEDSVSFYVKEGDKETSIWNNAVMGSYEFSNGNFKIGNNLYDSIEMAFVYSYYLDKAKISAKKEIDVSNKKISISTIEKTDNKVVIVMTTDFYETIKFNMVKQKNVYTVTLEKVEKTDKK